MNYYRFPLAKVDLTLEAAAEACGYSHASVKLWTESGDLPSRRKGARRYVNGQALEDFIRRHHTRMGLPLLKHGMQLPTDSDGNVLIAATPPSAKH